MLTIIVPYRNREDHLKQFIPHMNKYVPDAKIVIVEQVDDKPFNRGKLLNVGFLHSPTHTTPPTFCFHDVDLLPVQVNYYEGGGVQQKVLSDIQLKDYLGGVTIFDYSTFIKVGGYHNDYFHRAEDNEMMFCLKRLRIPILLRPGIFQELSHQRPAIEFDPILWQKAQLPRNINMLENCKYELISKEIHDTHTHLKVGL